MKKLTALAAVASVALMSSANAAQIFIDFTDREVVPAGVVSNPYDVDLGDGLIMTITGSSVFNNNQDAAGACTNDNFGIASPVFECDSDGLGIGDDELSTGDPTNQTITIGFNQAVGLVNAFFLDFFRASADDQFPERASVTINGGTPFIFEASEVFPANGGVFPAAAFGTQVTEIVFEALPGNDEIGVGDFALAGLTINTNPEIDQEVPVPGAALLFGTALALGAARRKAKAKA
ncbi:MAG: hypothetical protein V2I43_16605 [Parvularcula sp.]|nr:hypothetical protein [Parvularcula sp.]